MLRMQSHMALLRMNPEERQIIEACTEQTVDIIYCHLNYPVDLGRRMTHMASKESQTFLSFINFENPCFFAQKYQS